MGCTKGNAAQWQALFSQADADGILDALLLRRYDGHPSKTWIELQMPAVHQELASFEARADALWDRITIGQTNISAALSYMGFLFSAKDWRHLTPVLPTWHMSVSERSFMKVIVPDRSDMSHY